FRMCAHAGHISRLTAVAAAILDRSAFEHHDGGAGFSGSQGGAQGSIASANDGHVRFWDLFSHGLQSYIISPLWRRSMTAGDATGDGPRAVRRRQPPPRAASTLDRPYTTAAG